ncbi:hypothetical protein EMIHUDRAFT_198420 [Emiliania huxleyi CCMP1516]|uniref:RecF/RecN/SMC N-terminal domain-containing protein n=4 Tax=Emiliania huxleyi TaxID=2903 RepID=A0A0D3I785_EMIH1|nr:hypothetical protein EMIHUDRAFT_198420 [Emiliania huxleyi CCMP1516]EOD07120.1 hypothetical protein EMIHUDRAFT_198420 [Emiliania huxleyi CCMP1516]|eukprot:XP_005759549.1 hypothetical protein EMIHUDRAFT_198420 [Emiliania huxleyi CCMP1516]
MRPLILVSTINSRHWNTCYLQLLSSDSTRPSIVERYKKVCMNDVVTYVHGQESHRLQRSPMAGERPDTAMEPGSAALEPRAPQRVMITRMVLDNFKSYAGPITIGPFDANMTSVVGPNGSGKSNVIDAMLFVFGFRANKMRQGKLSELIHSSSRHPNLQYTKVSVHFRDVVDLPDGTVQPVEGTELVVAREAKQDNSSTYWVNGKRAGREEVVTLLKRRGIDLDHNRFLILQGEVEQIAMMKPKAPSAHEDGLLEYLEDIIGSNRLKEPIAEAQTQVETLNESRAARLNALKSAMQLEAAAAQRAALEKRLDSARAASQPSEAEVARLAELAKEIKALGKRVGEGEKKVGAADATLASLQEQVLAVGGIKLRAQKSKVETLGEQAVTKAEVGLESKTAAQAKLEASLSKQQAAAEGLERQAMQLEAAAAQRAALEKRLDSARAASQPSEAEVARLAELAKEIKALGKRVGEGEKKVGAADATLASLQEQVLAVGGIKLRAQKSKVETLGEQAVTKAEVGLESKTAAQAKLEASLSKQQAAAEGLERQIDAALDFRNVSIVGNYIKERTRNAQFVIISLRNNMLVGIYKTKDCTKSVAINPGAFTISARA